MNGPKKVAKLHAILEANDYKGRPVRKGASGGEVRAAARQAGVVTGQRAHSNKNRNARRRRKR